MTDINLPDLYANMQFEMLQILQVGASAFGHPGTKGDNTEANWIEWFRKYLPSRYAVDKATIIDSNGKCSDQIDVVIYDSQYSYLVFHQQDSKLIPAESVYAVFEVKQNLNKEHMEYAQGKAESVRTLCRSSAPIQHAGGHYDPKPLHEILAGILTTKSDWTAPIASTATKYINITNHNKRLDFVCSISGSTFVVDNNIFIAQYDVKKIPVIQSCENNQALIFFLLNLLKKLQDIGTVPAIDYTKYASTISSKLQKST